MSAKQGFKELFAKARKRFSYYLEGAKLSFTEAVVSRMSELSVSKSHLAKKIGCKPSYVTKVLRGSTNFTLESMVKIALALDSEIEIALVPKGGSEKSEDVLKTVTKANPAKEKFDWSVTRGGFTLLQPTTRRFNLDEPEAAITVTAY